MAKEVQNKLAILDDYFDIAPKKFSHLSASVEIVSFPKTLDVRRDDEQQELISRLRAFAIISTMRERTRFPAEVLRSLPNLKLILTTGLGNAAIDLNACQDLGIMVAGASGVGRTGADPPTLSSLDSTTEQTWALILGLTRNIALDDQTIRQGGWQTHPAVGLKGKTLALLGLGRLGSMSAKIAVLAFGMKVIAWSSNLTQDVADQKAQTAGLPRGSYRVAASKEDLIKQADVLSIHYVLSDRSRGIVGARELALMKSEAVLINTSRGPLVDEEALLDVLQHGRIKGAALDVYDIEPLPTNSPWRKILWGQEGRSQVLLSPHTGYAEEQVMNRWYDENVENLERYLQGETLRNIMTK